MAAARIEPRRRGVLGDLLTGLGDSTRIPSSAPSGSALHFSGEAEHGICYRRKYATGQRQGFKIPLGMRLPSSVHSEGLHPLPQPVYLGKSSQNTSMKSFTPAKKNHSPTLRGVPTSFRNGLISDQELLPRRNPLILQVNPDPLTQAEGHDGGMAQFFPGWFPNWLTCTVF